MPIMPRKDGKIKKIAVDILGLPIDIDSSGNVKKRRRKKKTEEIIEFQQISDVK